MWRHIGGTSVNPNLGAGPAGGAFTVLPGGVGPAGAFGDRTYDDGFVNIGAATPATGRTTNFSYDNDTQIIGGNLVYTKAGGTSFDSPVPGRDGDQDFAAPFIELAYMATVEPGLEIGITTNFAFTGLDSRLSQNITSYAVTTRDSYPLGGVILPLAPFTGSFAGPGPTIPNIPGMREQLLTPTGTGAYVFETDTDLFSLAFGTEIAWSPVPDLFLNAGAGVVMNYARWDANYRVPTAAAGVVTGSDSGSEFLLGLYLKAGAEYRFDEQWSVDGFLRYDWNESLEGSVGPTTFEVDLSGFSVGLGVTYHY